jgi:MFS family permease
MTVKANLRRNLQYSSLDNFLFSVTVGAGETFLPAFALAMGLGAVTAGMLTALPFLIGSALQLAAPRALEFVGSYRRWLAGLGVIQALSFLPLTWFASRGQEISSTMLYLVVTVYWACGLASGPAWSSWMTSLVPHKLRPRYFASRSHLGQFGLLLGLVAGGFLLDFAKRGGWETHAFAALFLFSGVFRIASAFCLWKQSEHPSMLKSQKRIPVSDLIARLRSGKDGRFIGFLILFAVAFHFSAPFFNPFLLDSLKLSYGPYMGLITAMFIAKIGVFALLGRSSTNLRPMVLMRLGLIGSAILPVLWTLSPNYGFLALVHVVSGAVWAVWELGVTLALFGAIRDEERTSFLSIYNFASALMILAGTYMGGKVLSLMGDSTFTYFLIFGISSALRFFSVMIFDHMVDPAGQSQAISEFLQPVVTPLVKPLAPTNLIRVSSRTIGVLTGKRKASGQ